MWHITWLCGFGKQNFVHCDWHLVTIAFHAYFICYLSSFWLNSNLVPINDYSVTKFKYLIFTKSKFLPLSLCTLIQGLPCSFVVISGLVFTFVYFCILLWSFSPPHIHCMFCHMPGTASEGALYHNIYNSLSLSSLLHLLLAVYSDIIFVYLFLSGQILVHLLWCLILPSVLFILLPSGPKSRLAQCLPCLYLLDLLFYYFSCDGFILQPIVVTSTNNYVSTHNGITSSIKIILQTHIFADTFFCVYKSMKLNISSDLRKPGLVPGKSLSPATNFGSVLEKSWIYIMSNRMRNLHMQKYLYL